MAINSQPAILAAEITGMIETAVPSKSDIVAIQRQLLRLGAQPAPECVVESYYRCLLTDYLQRRFKLQLDSVPSCVNSSHRAASLVCSAASRHSHQCIPDPVWRAAWQRLRQQHHEVDIYVRDQRRKSLRRADLYFVALGQIVSVEFKYVGLHGLHDAKAVARQMRRFVENHAATLLVIYSGSKDGSEVRGVARLRELLGPAVPVVVVYGVTIPAANRKDQKWQKG